METRPGEAGASKGISTLQTRDSFPTDAKNPTISALCQQCVTSYQNLCNRIRDAPENGQGYGYDGDAASATVEDARLRFKAWAVNIAALHKAHLQSSLDYRLKKAAEIRLRILKILSNLEESLVSATSIVTGVEPNETWEVGAFSDSEDEDSNTHGEAAMTSDLEELFAAIKASNSSLMKMTMVIRNSPARDDYLKAASRYRFDPRYDVGHVKEKHGTAKRQEAWLLERLGKAITRRRQFLKYREEHHGKLTKDWEEPDPIEAKPEDEHEKPRTVALTKLTKATTFIETIPTVMPHVEPHQGSEMGGSFGSQTSYEATIAGEAAEVRLTVPPHPQMAFEGVPFEFGEPFQCPYCYTEQTVKNRAAWKKHVFRDLKPYVCTFRKCELRMFRSRNEWFAHEIQAHRREWTCPRCETAAFSTSGSFENHLSEAHQILLGGSQLEALVLQSEEPVNKIAASACHLCDEWETDLLDEKHTSRRLFLNDGREVEAYGTLKQFRRHLGRHMEQLALFALPMNEGDEMEDDSANNDKDDGESEDDLDEAEHESGAAGTESSETNAWKPQPWKAHISLIQTISQPFAFELDTTAYKRCLSRGLYRTISVPDSDDYSFQTTVNQVFSDILRGRPWQPLVPRMRSNPRLGKALRRLPDLLVDSGYDVEFLKMNCAITDGRGNIVDLYIALSDEKISWAEMRELPPYVEGLESSWTYDPQLDGSSTIKCICNFDGDDEATIHCEKCDTWQHIECFYPGRVAVESIDHANHLCADCDPRSLDRDLAIAYQRNRQNTASNNTSSMPTRKSAVIEALLHNFAFVKDSESVKFPHGFMSLFKKSLEGVLNESEKQLEYKDRAVRRTFAELYRVFTEQRFQEKISKERRVRDLILICYSNAAKSLEKFTINDDDLRRHVALFVRLIGTTLKDHGYEKDKSELVVRLMTLESNLLANLPYRQTEQDSDVTRLEEDATDSAATLHVTGIDPSVSSADVIRVFERYGDVKKIRVLRDQPRVARLVEMGTVEQADAALEGLQDDDQVFERQRLVIKKIQVKSPSADIEAADQAPSEDRSYNEEYDRLIRINRVNQQVTASQEDRQTLQALEERERWEMDEPESISKFPTPQSVDINAGGSPDGPMPPASIAKSSVETGFHAESKSEMNSKDEQFKSIIFKHYLTLKGYLAGENDKGSNRARDKLLRLSSVQFSELSTDTFDELLRRQEVEKMTTTSHDKPPVFLYPNDTFHPKRNQAREKLSTLPQSRFRDLASDVFHEIERRFPRFAEGDISRGNEPWETDEPVSSQNFSAPVANSIDASDKVGKRAGTNEAQVEVEKSRLETLRNDLGSEHPTTLAAIYDLARAYRKLGNLLQAYELLEKLLESRKRVLGEHHPNTLTVLFELGTCSRDLGRISEAILLLEETLQSYRKILGNEHIETRLVARSLVGCYQETGRFIESAALEDEFFPSKEGFVIPNDADLQWSMDRVLRWLATNEFSQEWQETLKALDIHGSVFLELGSGSGGRGNFGMMHQQVYPHLAKECSRTGTGWDQAREREEGKRLRRLIRGIVKGKNYVSGDAQIPTPNMKQDVPKYSGGIISRSATKKDELTWDASRAEGTAIQGVNTVEYSIAEYDVINILEGEVGLEFPLQLKAGSVESGELLLWQLKAKVVEALHLSKHESENMKLFCGNVPLEGNDKSCRDFGIGNFSDVRCILGSAHEILPDSASILDTLPPALRQQILMDQDEDMFNALPQQPLVSREGRASSSSHPSVPTPVLSVEASDPQPPTLNEILADKAPPPFTLNDFLAYLKDNHCLETYEFISAANRYSDHWKRLFAEPELDRRDPTSEMSAQVRTLWQQIIQEFIAPNGLQELNLPANIRDRLLFLPYADPYPPNPEALYEPLKIIRELMEGSILKGFFQALANEKYVSWMSQWQSKSSRSAA